jgi:hypothetical protein
LIDYPSPPVHHSLPQTPTLFFLRVRRRSGLTTLRLCATLPQITHPLWKVILCVCRLCGTGKKRRVM